MGGKCSTQECDQSRAKRHNARPISCDQVAWMLDAIGRYIPRDSHPSVSRARDMQMYGLLYELMDVANLRFEDDSARWNGTPNEARDYGLITNYCPWCGGRPGRVHAGKEPT